MYKLNVNAYLFIKIVSYSLARKLIICIFALSLTNDLLTFELNLKKLMFSSFLNDDSKNGQFKRSLLRFMASKGCSTIQDLAKEMAVSLPTITKVVSELQIMGYVSECGKLGKGEGRRPVLYGINPKSGYVVGVEVKANFVSIGLMDACANMVKETGKLPCDIENSMDSIDELCGLVAGFIERADIDKSKVLNIMFCVSGRVNSESGYSHTLYNFLQEPLSKVLSDKLHFPVSIENDTRAYTYGEYARGAVEGERNVLFFNVSWGLGLGIIINGELYRGRSGFAGEIGHMHMFNNEILCHCGKKGCLETEASGCALERQVRGRIAAGASSYLTMKHGNNFTLNDILDAINDEDLLCMEVLESVGLKLGESVANLINVFNPELVVIGGLLSRAGDFLLQAVKASVSKYSLGIVNKDTRICLSRLNERGGVLGACLLARKALIW